MSLHFDPLIDCRIIAALAAIAALIGTVSILNRMPGAWLRVGAFALFGLALMNPSVREEDRETLPGILTVVVDRSASQSIGERTAQTDEAREKLAAVLEGIPGFETRWVEAGDEAGDGTDLFSPLERALSDVPSERIAGVIMLTDGQVHTLPADAQRLGFDAPVHALITGNNDERDRRLVVRSSPRFGIVGEEQPITFRVEDVGLEETGEVTVTLRRDGETVAIVQVRPGRDLTVPVEIAHGGQNIIEIEAAAAEGELTTINNRSVSTVDGIRDNLRVLLVSGEPHSGERTWRNILKSDAAVDLVHFTILRPPEKQDGTPISQLSLIAFPTRELFSVKIDEFDLIIFDRYHRRGVLPILYFDNIARYVRDGGAVLLAAGPDYAGGTSLFRTPLSPVLPAEPTGNVVTEPYRAAVSLMGRRHPITRELDPKAGETPPWSRWFRLVEADVANATTLMTGPRDLPLLVVNREGEGRVATLLSDHAWLWARGYEGGGPYVPLLRRLAHWLMKENDLEEEALKASHRGDVLTVERRSMADEVGPARVTAPSGETSEITLSPAGPGIWRGTIEARELGIWRIAQDDLTALVNAGPANPREYADVRSTEEVLAPLTGATGAGIARLEQATGLKVPRILPVRAGARMSGNGWFGLKQSEATILHGISTLPLVAGFLGLALLLASLTATWFREGR